MPTQEVVATVDYAALYKQEQEKNARLKEKLSKKNALRLKVSDKGAVSLYGIHTRFPITLYANQWGKVAEFMPSILSFIKENAAHLSVREQDVD